MTELRTSASTRIEAPPEVVWDAITTPATIRRWFFGVETETDWRPGSPIVHRGEWQGKPYVDEGRILEVDPPRRLVHTHWSELSGTPNTPEHHQKVTWSLTERDGGTELTVSERNLPSAEAKATSDQSWATVLRNLKDLLEG
ncbi:MAG TPA: SRPBCC domain-containing protein [Actinomycetota bacterium]|nr:SRPBCC domain-containing protein [Actinomycetota bacterium]